MYRAPLILIVLSVLTTSCRKNPIASYEIEVLNCNSPYQVEFRNTSTNFSDYYWVIDGETYQNIDPIVELNAVEYHNMELVVNNHKKSVHLNLNFQAEQFYELPKSDFRWSYPDCQQYLKTQFNNRSKGKIDSYYWEFGDGTTSTQKDPLHYYPSAGNYSVRLYTIRCSDSIYKTYSINITPDNVLPNSKFKFRTTQTRPNQSTFFNGDEIKFTNQSSNASTYIWRYGDGYTSTSTHPKHTYSSTGTYEVELVAICGLNRDSTTRSITISEPQGVKIKNISITDYPDKNGYDEWDYVEGEEITGSELKPDIYVVLRKGSSVLFTSSTKDNVTSSSGLSWSTDKVLDSFSYEYDIVVYDEDDGGGQEMGEVHFEIEEHSGFGNYPSTITIGDYETEITIKLQ